MSKPTGLDAWRIDGFRRRRSQSLLECNRPEPDMIGDPDGRVFEFTSA